MTYISNLFSITLSLVGKLLCAQIIINRIYSNSWQDFSSTAKEVLKFVQSIERMLHTYIPSTVTQRISTILHSGFFSDIDKSDEYYLKFRKTEWVTREYQTNSTRNDEIISAFVILGDKDLGVLIKRLKIKSDYLEDYQITNYGAHFIPKTDNIKGSYILIMGIEIPLKIQKYSEVLLKQGYEVILHQGLTHTTVPDYKAFPVKTDIKGIFIFAHGMVSPKGRHIIQYKESIFWASANLDTITLIHHLRYSYKNKINNDLELGIISCYSGVINITKLLTLLPELNHIYLSSKGDYLTFSLQIGNYMIEDADKYNFGHDISPLEFLYLYNSVMPPYFYIYQEDLRKINILELDQRAVGFLPTYKSKMINTIGKVVQFIRGEIIVGQKKEELLKEISKELKSTYNITNKLPQTQNQSKTQMSQAIDLEFEYDQLENDLNPVDNDQVLCGLIENLYPYHEEL